MKTFLCVLALLSASAVVQAAPVAKPVAAPVVAELPTEKDGLRVSISATASDDPWVDGDVLTRYIRLNASDAFINVVIQNISDKPIRIFQESNSVGYGNLTLEVTKVGDQVLPKSIIVARHGGTWFSNAAISEIIEPGTALVRRMQFLVPVESPDTKRITFPPMYLYSDFPFPNSSTSKRITMRAMFSNKFAVGSEKEPVWTGTIASKPLEYSVFFIDDRPKPKPN